MIKHPFLPITSNRIVPFFIAKGWFTGVRAVKGEKSKRTITFSGGRRRFFDWHYPIEFGGSSDGIDADGKVRMNQLRMRVRVSPSFPHPGV